MKLSKTERLLLIVCIGYSLLAIEVIVKSFITRTSPDFHSVLIILGAIVNVLFFMRIRKDSK